MPLIGTPNPLDQTELAPLELEVDAQKGVVSEKSTYNPSEEEKAVRGMIITHFQLGWTNLYTPRVEFSDLSAFGRDQTDFLAWNTYQPNNGDPYEGDQIAGWRSNAMRPIERNKAISIAAHATARLLFPKIFAYDNQSEYQKDAARVMMDLMEWAAERSNYAYTSLMAVIQSLVAPASIVHTEYAEVYRDVKTEKSGGKWKTKRVMDDVMSGFKDSIVPVDQMLIENFFEPDIQKQSWLIWRRVQSYQTMREKYGHLENFKHVKPGMQVLYSDPNAGFYYVYDPNMRQYMCEEIVYYNRSMDLEIVMVNGVMLTSHDNPNPRVDKLYPFAKFGYEVINSRCFYYKSLVFKVSHDANIINTLYPMIIDGTYLNMMPPMINNGGEAISSDVIIPGAVTTLSDPNASLTPVKMATDIKSGLDALFKVEESINQSTELPVAPPGGGDQTAYEISKREQERNTILGLYIQMIGDYVKQFGELRKGDILQYMTIADVDKITDDPELVYKTFLLHNKKSTSSGRVKNRKIAFDESLPDKATEEGELGESYKTLEKQGGADTDVELYRVNPVLFRELQYMVMVSPDVLNPMSEEVERAFKLELYDRAIQNPTANQEEVTRDFLFGANPASSKDPDKYMAKKPEGGMDAMMQMAQGGGMPLPQNGQMGNTGGQSPMLKGLTGAPTAPITK